MQAHRSRSALPKLATQSAIAVCLFLSALLTIPRLSANGSPQVNPSVALQESSAKSVEPKDDETKDDEIKADELVGVVVDENENLLADALIDAWSWYPGNETRTDAQGRFHLKFGDARRKVELRVMKDGYSPLYRPQQPLGVRDFKIVLGQKTYIEGFVRNANGDPVPNIEVRGEQGPQQADGIMIGSVEMKPSCRISSCSRECGLKRKSSIA